MNIFVLDNNPELAVQYHVDSHVLKMTIEVAQILSTAHRILDGNEYLEKSKNNRSVKRWKLPDTRENILYKATHINHPCTLWARSSSENYIWLYRMFVELCKEYKYRYGKTHKTSSLIEALEYPPANLDCTEFTDFAQSMPKSCKSSDGVTAYRTYYKLEKQKLHKYTRRSRPEWL